VVISLQQEDARGLVLSVADTGIGIAPEEQKRIFERFYRPDNRVQTGSGFGLGLAIVHELVEAMGGKLQLESKVGEGSCFRVILPIA
jgi:signal transduction histidine kinase